MTFRKRRRPTPSFGVPPPFNPTVGQHATLGVPGIHPYCAMMQVAATDSYADYVICRGFDPRIRKFIDYAAGDPNNPGISVAKPYGKRVAGTYKVAEVYAAFLPTQGTVATFGSEVGMETYTPPSPTSVDWRVGQNPGTAPTSYSGGQPTALVDQITELTDHNGKYVQWMLVDSGPSESVFLLWGIAKENWTDNGASCDHVVVYTCDDCEGTNPTATEHTVLLPKTAEQDPNVVQDEVIAYTLANDGTYVAVTDYLDDKIGTVKMWALLSTGIPPGWAEMNGQANSIANGGTGINLRDRFVRCGRTPGARGGQEKHNHQIDVIIDVDVNVWVAFAEAILDNSTITIPDHSESDLDHYHALALDTLSIGWESESITWDGAAHNVWTEDQTRRVGCTGGPDEDNACGGTVWGPLSHTPVWSYDSGGLASAVSKAWAYSTASSYIEEEKHIPPYTDLIYIERIDNSA